MKKEAKVKTKQRKKNKAKVIPKNVAKIEFQNKLREIEHLCIVVVQIDSKFCVTDEKCFIKYWFDIMRNKIIRTSVLQGKPHMLYYERFHLNIRRYMNNKITMISLPHYFIECGIDIRNRGEIVEIRRKV